MSRVPVGVDQQELYVAARRVLLDALQALAPHRDAIVLIGAQAVYLHAASAQLGVAAYTADGDLALDPALLADEPLLQTAMQQAGFSRALVQPDQPGLWWKQQIVGAQQVNIEVDLLVPHQLSTGGRRSATIPPHDSRAVHRVPGIEVTMVDNALATVTSLRPDTDTRSLQVRVAGVAALLVAKSIKIGERLENPRPDRLVDKDASDILAMMMASDADQVAATFEYLLTDQKVTDVARQGLTHLPGSAVAGGHAGGAAVVEVLKVPPPRPRPGRHQPLPGMSGGGPDSARAAELGHSFAIAIQWAGVGSFGVTPSWVSRALLCPEVSR